MLIQCAGITHVGRVRTNNEDNLYIEGIYREDISVNYFSTGNHEYKHCTCAVCDGVGGESLGEMASLYAVKSIVDKNISDVGFSTIINEANERICEERRRNNDIRIGSTIAAITISEANSSVCNVGDSRVYRYRESGVTQLTKDHTRVQQLVDAGLIDSEEARTHSLGHVLTQHLGVFDEEFIISPYINETINMNKGDIFLLCSDGITDMLTNNEICDLLVGLEGQDADTISRAILSQALENGGKDNATIIVAKILSV